MYTTYDYVLLFRDAQVLEYEPETMLYHARIRCADTVTLHLAIDYMFSHMKIPVIQPYKIYKSSIDDISIHSRTIDITYRLSWYACGLSRTSATTLHVSERTLKLLQFNE